MGLVSMNPHHNESIFGLDIGQTSMKVLQLHAVGGKTPSVVGYGVSGFYSGDAIKNGQIVDEKTIAHSLNSLLQSGLVGSITTNRVACTLQTSHTFSRPMKLPKMEKDQIEEAVQLETEQYIPLPSDKLYIDYEITASDEQNMDLLVVAAPKDIVDSYMHFLDAVGLEPVALEPSMNAMARLFKLADPSHDSPSILVDFGSLSTDIAVFDKSLFVNSTIEDGSDNITKLVAEKLGINLQNAYDMKNQEGVGTADKPSKIIFAISPLIDKLIREIRRTVRYYDDRIGHARNITQVITTGGGATLPGLSEYLSAQLKMPVRMLDPWDKLDFGGLKPPNSTAKSVYLTVAGEALLSPQELHR